jgi:hypothetical protein
VRSSCMVAILCARARSRSEFAATSLFFGASTRDACPVKAPPTEGCYSPGLLMTTDPMGEGEGEDEYGGERRLPLRPDSAELNDRQGVCLPRRL